MGAGRRAASPPARPAHRGAHAGRWRTVSAFGRSAVAANTATTAAIVMGDDALDWLHDKDVAARLVAQDGTVVRTPGWARQVVSS